MKLYLTQLHMEKKMDSECCSSSSSIYHNWLVKIVLGLLIIGLIGSVICFHFNRFYRDGGRYGMMNGNYDNVGPGMMPGRWSQESYKGSARVFGTITQVESGKITIQDNAGKSQVVNSLANTVITSGGLEISFSQLQVGDNVVVYSKKNKDNDDATEDAVVTSATTAIDASSIIVQTK